MSYLREESDGVLTPSGHLEPGVGKVWDVEHAGRWYRKLKNETAEQADCEKGGPSLLADFPTFGHRQTQHIAIYLSRSGLKVMQVQFTLDEHGVIWGSPFSDMLFLNTYAGRVAKVGR